MANNMALALIPGGPSGPGPSTGTFDSDYDDSESQSTSRSSSSLCSRKNALSGSVLSPSQMSNIVKLSQPIALAGALLISNRLGFHQAQNRQLMEKYEIEIQKLKVKPDQSVPEFRDVVKFASPLMKTKDGMFPPNFGANRPELECPWADYNFQNWTKLDIVDLKRFIVEDLREQDLESFGDQKQEMMKALKSNIRGQGKQSIPSSSGQPSSEPGPSTSTNTTVPVKKSRGAHLTLRHTKRVRRIPKQNTKKTTSTDLCEVETNSGMKLKVSIPYTIDTLDKQEELIRKNKYEEAFNFGNKEATERINWGKVAEKITLKTKKERIASSCRTIFLSAVQTQKSKNRKKK